MKITFVLTNASMSGGTRVIVQYAEQLMARGHQVQVFSTAPPPPGLRRMVSSFVRGKGLPKIYKAGGPSFFDGSSVPHTIIPKFRPITDRDVPDADVVVATWWETAEWVARLSPSKGAKAFFIQHYESWGGDEKRVDAAWRLPLHKIVISRWLEDLAIQKFGAAQVSHVPNSVDMKLFNAPPRGKQQRPTAGLLYHRFWTKGVDVSNKAIREARQTLPDLRVLTFGEIPLSEHSAQTLNPADHIIKPPQEAIRDLYRQCDVWLCGSRSEGFHLPPLEAMACRCPVVSTKVGGPVDIIEDDRNGFLVEQEDFSALADRMVRVLKYDENRWRQMSDAAHETARQYTWEDATVLFEQALETAIARSRSAGQRIGA